MLNAAQTHKMHLHPDSAPPEAILRMAIATPLSQLPALFDYLALDNTVLDTLQPGMRFRVPFGNRQLIAYFICIEKNSAHAPQKLKKVLEQLDLEQACVDQSLFALIQWSAHYYQQNIGLCLQTALPKKVRQGESTAPLPEIGWQLSPKGLGLSEQALKNAKRQHALILYLRENSAIKRSSLKALGFTTTSIKTLLSKALIEEIKLAPSSASLMTQPPALLKTAALSLNEQQQQALHLINSHTGFQCHLLDGITGSGKTEVYLQSIERVLHAGQQALVLIPEIALTPQTLERFSERFSCPVLSLHSQLNDTQRFHHWLQAQRGTAKIVIGTRSAVFTPFSKLGMIIVDEEHDASYKQQTGFHYSAKDVAIRRAQQLNIPIILGSATPSCESLYNAQRKRYRYHRLTQRANAAQPPQVQLIDLRKQALEEGFSQALLVQIQHCLAHEEQVIVFINRRGFAPTLLCHSCGWLAHCPNCDTRLTVHKQAQQLRCHHCAHQKMLPATCPQCHSIELRALGSGTQRSEHFLQQRFPHTPVIRIDSDSTQNNAYLQTTLAQLSQAQAAILIGTQILAKGHHFPKVTLVVILDSDTWLFADDFRGEERMAQLMTQVTGRSGRGTQLGKTFIQTHLPEHPFWQLFFSGGYALLAKNILAQRQATLMPPFAHLCILHAEHSDAQKALALLNQARHWLEDKRNPHFAQLACIGPYPSALARKARRYRFLLQLKHTQRQVLHNAVHMLRDFMRQLPLAKRVNWSLDIDPQENN